MSLLTQPAAEECSTRADALSQGPQQHTSAVVRSLGPSLRLLTGGSFAALGALTVMPAPASSLWLASIIATEFGYLLVVFPVLVLLPGWRRSTAGWLGALLSVAATVLLAMPVLRAMQTSRSLPALFAARFGTDERQRSEFAGDSRTVPFALTELFRPVQSRPVRYAQRPFKGLGGSELTLDIYRPAHLHGPIPGVLVIHGESWPRGQGRELVALNGYLAARDFLVVAISDRLAARRPLLGARNDVLSTIAFLKVHASELGLDPARLAILGRSVAGHLALLVAYTVNDPAIRGAIALYAPSDLRRWYASAADEGVLDTRRILSDYLGGLPAQAQDVYDAASPITFVRRNMPATLLVHGMRDGLIPPEQSERLAARLEQHGVPHVLIRLPWATHGCDRNFAGPCGQIVTYAVERFLNAVLQQPAVPMKRGKPAGAS